MNYFTEKELRCRHCGENHIEPSFLEKLNRMRHEAGFPFPVSSAYRCPAHNMNVSSTGPNGPHTTGRAIDIKVSGERAFWIISNAARFGFTGIGVNQKGDYSGRFIHLDDLEEGRPWVWSY